MNEPRYNKIENVDYRVYTFTSEGRHGNLVKVVTFEEIDEIENTFNLALGTMQSDGKIDFLSITNNGDRNKILATVAAIVNIFLDRFPGKNVYITGSDARRTLLYNRSIAYGYDELVQMFNIYGDSSPDGDVCEFELFEKGKNYSGFLIEKIINDEQLHLC